MNERLQDYGKRIEALSHSLGLSYYPVDFELVPNNFMNEVAIYGLPIRMPHWSFGVRYIHQLVRQSMGNSKIFISRADGTHAKPLTSASSGTSFDPKFSPNGKKITFSSNRAGDTNANYEAFVMKADGSHEHRLTPTTFSNYPTDWAVLH